MNRQARPVARILPGFLASRFFPCSSPLHAFLLSSEIFLFDIDLAHALLLADGFHLVPRQVAQSYGLRDGINQHQWTGCVGRSQLHVFNADQSANKRLASLNVLNPIKLKRVGVLLNTPSVIFTRSVVSSYTLFRVVR